MIILATRFYFLKHKTRFNRYFYFVPKSRFTPKLKQNKNNQSSLPLTRQGNVHNFKVTVMLINILLIFTMIAVYSLHGVFVKLYSAEYPGRPQDASSVYTVMLGVIVTIITLCVSGFNMSPNLYTWIFGIVNGVSIFFFNYSMVESSKRGSYALLMIFALAGAIILPIIVTAIAFGEVPSILQIVGIAIMFIAFFLMCHEGKFKAQRKPGYYFFCIMLAVSNGIFGTVNALPKFFERDLSITVNSTDLVIIEYVVTAIMSLIILLVNKKGKILPSFRQKPKSMLFAVLGAACITAGINLLMVCLDFVDVAALYTVQNGGMLMLSALWSLILFKEKLNVKKWIGIVIATISTVLLAI